MNTYKKQYLSAFVMAALLTASCSKEPTTFVPNQVDSFTTDNQDSYQQASKLLQADYVFSFDVGYSMFNNRQVLQDAFLAFANLLASQNIDYRIGLINGGVHAYPTNVFSETSGSFMGGTFLSQSPGNLASQLIGQIIPIGQPLNENTEVQLSAVRKTLEAQKHNFIRPGSSLIIVYVGDEDDQSHQNGFPASYPFGTSPLDYIAHAKTLVDPSFLKGRAVIKTGKAGCLATGTESVGLRLGAVAAGIDSDTSNVDDVSTCVDNNFNGFLQDLATKAANVSKPIEKFALQSTSYDAASLRVYVNGALQSPGTDYDVVNHIVIFKTGHTPAFNAQVLIQYESRYILSSRPNVTTLTVAVDGTSIPENGGNGWTYNSSDNSIQLHGSALPADGSEIRVSYTLN